METPNRKNANWFLIAMIVSVIYAAGVVWLIGWHSITNFITSSSSSLNSIGDFTAGMFAPIAVLWLVAAVQTQRQELADAREQADHARKVVDEQLSLIKAQQQAAEQQAQQAIHNAELTYRLSLYEKRNAIYQRFVMLGVDDHGSGDWNDDGYWALLKLAQEASFVFDDKIEAWINEIASEVSEYLGYIGENPYETYQDPSGNTIEARNEGNEQIRRERHSYTDWIAEQFLPDTCTAKFFPYMHVSDRPYLSAVVEEKKG